MVVRRLLPAILIAALLAGCAAGPSATPTPATETNVVSSGGAASFEKLSFADLVRRSDRVIVATVLSTESAWNANKTAIYTTVRLGVEDTAKGAGASSIALVVEGGQVGEVAQAVEGAHPFTVGERLVLFLGGGGIVGGPQGVYAVVDGKVNDQPLSVFLEQVRAAK